MRNDGITDADGRTAETPGLELASDRPFERRFWLAQRIIWAVLDGILLLALVGLLGKGPLNAAQTRSDAAVVVSYERVLRMRSPGLLEVELKAAANLPQKTVVELNRALVEQYSIEQVWPQPLITQPIHGGLRFFFATDPDAAPGRIRFTVKPNAPGLVNATIAVKGQAPVNFRQLILP